MYKQLINNKRLLLTLLPLLLAAALFVPSHVVPSARGQFTGLVCIVFPSTATSCPTASPTYGPFSVGQTFTVGVFIQGSDAMGGFDVYVASNPAFVSPSSAALGTLVASPSLTSICVNGSAQTGSCTANAANGAGVVEVTTIDSSGTNECGGISPCSGLAFTITYTVVSAVASTTLAFPSSGGCANTSVMGTTECVLVADAIGTTLPEAIQTPAATITQTISTFKGLCVTYPSTASSCPNIPPQTLATTFGSTVVLGVFLQNSAPIGGYDIYVSADAHYLNPVSVALGGLIANATNTNICVDGSAQTGSCTVNSANGPGVVEVSTIEASGNNDPGTGLAFSVTYQVVGVTPTTTVAYPISNPSCSNTSNATNVCVLVADSFGNAIPENIVGAIVTQTHPVDPSTILKSCSPNPVVVGQQTFCIATVSDPATTGAVAPIGTFTWSSDGFGTFNPTSCTLQAINSFQSQCNSQYSPLGVGSGTSNIFGVYSGDTIHTGATDPFPLTITPATAVVSTAVIVDQTGGPPPGGFVQTGQSVHDVAIMIPGTGYPVTGATGVVGYLLYGPSTSTNTCTGTATSVSNSTLTIGGANNVKPSTSVTLAAGNYGFQAVYRPDTADNNKVTSACEPFSVIAYPGFTSGKLHWTHHLSLSKSANTQSWTAIVIDPLSVGVQVVVRIIGSSAINPSLNFDVTCGVVCVNTPRAGVGAINATQVGLISVGAGATATFSFSQTISSAFVNSKVAFTATVYFTTNGVDFTKGTSKSGAFAVVP